MAKNFVGYESQGGARGHATRLNKLRSGVARMGKKYAAHSLSHDVSASLDGHMLGWNANLLTRHKNKISQNHQLGFAPEVSKDGKCACMPKDVDQVCCLVNNTTRHVIWQDANHSNLGLCSA